MFLIVLADQVRCTRRDFFALFTDTNYARPRNRGGFFYGAIERQNGDRPLEQMSKSLTEIRSLARSYTEMAIQTLAGIAQNGEQEAARVRAAEALLDRGWGKPAQPIDGDGDGGPVQLKVTWLNGKS